MSVTPQLSGIALAGAGFRVRVGLVSEPRAAAAGSSFRQRGGVSMTHLPATRGTICGHGHARRICTAADGAPAEERETGGCVGPSILRGRCQQLGTGILEDRSGRGTRQDRFDGGAQAPSADHGRVHGGSDAPVCELVAGGEAVVSGSRASREDHDLAADDDAAALRDARPGRAARAGGRRNVGATAAFTQDRDHVAPERTKTPSALAGGRGFRATQTRQPNRAEKPYGATHCQGARMTFPSVSHFFRIATVAREILPPWHVTNGPAQHLLSPSSRRRVSRYRARSAARLFPTALRRFPALRCGDRSPRPGGAAPR